MAIRTILSTLFRSHGGEPDSTGRAVRPLKILIAASIVLPISVFLVACWISYVNHFDDARDRLVRTLGSIHEHAVKVFDTFEISARYIVELTDGYDDSEIREQEEEFSKRIRNFIDTLPQLRDLWIIDAAGRPLVAGTVYPMPRNMDLSDRDYFAAQKATSSPVTYIGAVVSARAADTRFFAITRKRSSADGRFNGINLVSIAPEYFESYYAKQPAANQGVTALFRADGTVLARYPQDDSAADHLSPDAAVLKGIATDPVFGVVIGISALDKRERMFAYRKLPYHNAYVVSGIETNSIRWAWAETMGSHLVFGLPATLGMVALGVVALARTRRESEAHAQLRDEVARRETTEQALRQSQKMEAVGRLTGGIAHDFNNLLTAIIGNIDMGLRRLKTDDDRIPRSLTAGREAAQRAATLVQRLLAFSRQHPHSVHAVDVNRLVQGMSELLHRAIGESITIETVLGSGLWKTAIDPNQLENAILNLAVNARDAMPAGGKLTVETANFYIDDDYVRRTADQLKAGQYVMLAVSDTGIGISPDIRDKIFEPFFTTKRVGHGSGLGLSMVYGFVKQSNGHIQIYSEPNQGTTVKMYFPRLPADSTIAEWPAPQAAPAPAPEASRHYTVLLVEDDKDVSDFVRDALTDLGYTVVHASDGPSALRLLEAHKEIDLLFTDVVLPGGINGRQLADEVRRLRPELPVLYATGYTRNAIVHHGRLDADVEVLTKPFTIEALARKIRDVLAGTTPHRG